MANKVRRGPSPRLLRDISGTRFERILSNASQLSLVAMGALAVLIALKLGEVVLAPVFLAVTVGLMFGPVADMMDRRGIPDGISAAVVVVLLLGLIALSAMLFAGPVGALVERIPIIWEAFRRELANWKEPLSAVGALQQQVQQVLGADPATVTVQVEDGSGVQDVALTAPALLAGMLIFLASLYFFMATRDQIRIFVLSLCTTRRVRWRTAHVFRDVEEQVSKFLLTVTAINIGMGIGVAALMAAIGMPTPILWGALAAVLNFIPFVGQAVMVVILFAVGLGTLNGLEGALLPVGLYLVLNFVEGNFVTPQLLGRTMMINPFLILFAITYWLWTWGPIGGFIAVPSLLVLFSIVRHILPMRPPVPKRVLRHAEAQPAASEKPADTAAPDKAPAKRKPTKAAATP
ncbi:MAG: family transporter [Devosia sp.]|uniref:AI-2E family transporter n=1 Tax=Devosia sp. TaxID=1871048 RepID=UPI002631EB8D|nr:AI-2E family transporter [Devosia sp.]MDB5542338.1 family transporter [Devosia sp.]